MRLFWCAGEVVDAGLAAAPFAAQNVTAASLANGVLLASAGADQGKLIAKGAGLGQVRHCAGRVGPVEVRVSAEGQALSGVRGATDIRVCWRGLTTGQRAT